MLNPTRVQWIRQSTFHNQHSRQPMIAQQFKDWYFALNRWLVLPNTLLCRTRFATPRDPEGHYIHLGSGTNYIDGMINVEGFVGRKRDAWLDLRNKLPFADGSAAFVWCSHTIE